MYVPAANPVISSVVWAVPAQENTYGGVPPITPLEEIEPFVLPKQVGSVPVKVTDQSNGDTIVKGSL